MSGTKKSHRWPDLLSDCIKCGLNKHVASYGRRGLCVSCDRVETSAGRIKQWEPVGRDVKKYSESHSRRTKDNYWRRKKAGDIYKIVSNIGLTEAASRLGASKEEITLWLNGGEVPVKFLELSKLLQNEIKSLTVQANSETREKEFFEYIKQPTLIFNGKSF
jgi:hypothetical protein